MHHVILRTQKNLQIVPDMHKNLRDLLTKAWKWFYFERDILALSLTIKELNRGKANTMTVIIPAKLGFS